MKKIKTVFILLVAMLAFNAVNAQPSETDKAKTKNVKPYEKLTAEQKAVRSADSLQVRLSLTKEQYTKVIPINAAYYKNKAALKLKYKSASDENDTYKKEAKQLRQSRDKDIAALLTPAQNETWKNWKQSKKDSHPNGNKMHKKGSE